MRKRPLFMGACVFAIGLLYAKYTRWYGILLFILIACYAVEFTIRKRQWGRLLVRSIWITGVFLLAVFHMNEELSFRKTELSLIAADDQLLLCGRIYKKEFKNEAYRYYLKDCIANNSDQQVICNHVIAYLDADSYSIGEILLLKGKVNMFEKASNEGQFDSCSFYASQKIDFALKEVQVLRTDGKPNLAAEWLYRQRNRMAEVYQIYLGERNAGVLSTMLLGEKSSLDYEIKELYQNAGISHVLSISGMHVSLIGMGVYRFLRKRGLRYRLSFLIAVPILSMYAVMTGSSVSTLRALGMLVIAMAADTLGRSCDMLNALGAVVGILLWDNPFLLWYSGFQLSVCAVMGIGVFVRYIVVRKDMGRKSKQKSLGLKLVNTIYSSLGIWLVTLPLVAWTYFEIPLYSFLLNAFILPFLKPLFLLGLSGGILGGNFAKILLFPCNVILEGYEALAELCMRLPGGTWIAGRPDIGRIVIYYLALVIVGLLCRKAADRHPVRWAGIAVLLLIAFFPGKKGFEVDVLDVGQGDGIYICTKEGTSIFIDGGSSNVSKVGTYRILPFLKCKGVRKVDYWLVTHSDEDHVSGLREVFEEGYEVRYLVLAETAIQKEASQGNNECESGKPTGASELTGLSELIALAEENGTEILTIKAGDRFEFGEEQFNCLYPTLSENTDDVNDLSLVMLYESEDLKCMFTGDISDAVEQKLLDRYDAEVLDVDVYKVAHHGSKYSSSEAFLQALTPEVSLISCSSTNSYGHPHAETLQRLEDAKSSVLATPEYGEITIEGGEEIMVSGFSAWE